MEQNYPVVQLLVRHGAMVAIAIGVVPVLFGLYWAVAGFGAVYAVGGLIAGAIAYLFVKSYVELVTIITDMLLPK